MKNKVFFEIANATNNTNLKQKLREDYLLWCNNNNKTLDSPTSIMEWLEIDNPADDE